MKIFLLISFFFVLSCKDNQRKIEYELLDFEVDRFEKKFFETHDDSLLNLIEEYPFLFSKRFNKEDWMAIKSDTIRQDIYKRTITVFNDFKTIENEITKIFKQTKSYFPKFIPPKLITINNGIDYEYKIIDSFIIDNKFALADWSSDLSKSKFGKLDYILYKSSNETNINFEKCKVDTNLRGLSDHPAIQAVFNLEN